MHTYCTCTPQVTAHIAPHFPESDPTKHYINTCGKFGLSKGQISTKLFSFHTTNHGSTKNFKGGAAVKIADKLSFKLCDI